MQCPLPPILNGCRARWRARGSTVESRSGEPVPLSSQDCLGLGVLRAARGGGLGEAQARLVLKHILVWGAP